MRWLGLLVVVLGIAHGAFVPPTDGPLPFRRDKLPIDVETMTGLSEDLAVLVGSVKGDKPEDRRARAQLLALSLALQPANQRARDLVKALAAGNKVDVSDGQRVEAAVEMASKIKAWTEQEIAGPDGNAFAACLGDVLVRFGQSQDGESGRWQGWVAPTEDFKDQQKPAPEPEPASQQPDAGPVAKVVLAKASMEVPLWFYDANLRSLVLRNVVLSMEAAPTDKPRKVNVVFPSGDRADFDRRMSDRLTEWVVGHHGELKRGWVLWFRLAGKSAYDFTLNGGAVSGPMLALADAAFGGPKPVGEGLALLADVTSSGGMVAPPRLWETLRALEKLEQPRWIVMPTALRDYLPPLLTVGDTLFFLNHEVMLADDEAALLELGAEQRPQRLKEAGELFAAIRRDRGTRSLGSFLTVSANRVRFAAVLDKAPEHASARMLMLRGTPQWPKSLDRAAYARAVRAALEPMELALRKPWDSDFLSRDLTGAADKCREGLGEVEKLYSSLSDREELHDRAALTVKELASLSSEFRRRELGTYMVPNLVKPVFAEFQATIKFLSREAGDEVAAVATPKFKVVAATGEEQPQRWRYTFKQPEAGWEKPGFDDSTWKWGESGFGTRETPGSVVRTRWSSDDIWLRRTFQIDAPVTGRVLLRIHHDERARVMINGVEVADLRGFVQNYSDRSIPAKVLKPGLNVLAIHCHQTVEGQYIDAGIRIEVAP